MNFIVKPYDPLEEAMQLFAEFNETPEGEREYSEQELTSLIVNKVKAHDRTN